MRHRTAAMVDPLTGIANRRSFMQDAALMAKQHIADPRPTAVLLIDLDHFKSINDRFGHALGDRVLEIFTDAARKSTRGSDLIGRLGGEEFAAMLIDTNRDKAVEVAERIRESFAQMAQEVDGRAVCATVSIGLVHTEAPTLDLAGTARPGRPGALLRQGTRPQPRRGCFARHDGRTPHDGRRGGRNRCQESPPRAQPEPQPALP